MTLTMVGQLSECILLSYSTPVAAVERFLPAGFQPLVHDGHAFWNIVISTIDKMRPRGVPRWAGITYHHIAYRLQVSVNTSGGRLSGLYFVRSDVDHFLIARPANLLTDFKIHLSDIKISHRDGSLETTVHNPDPAASAKLRLDTSSPAEIDTGLFANPSDRHHVLKYQPLGLAPGTRGRIRLAEVLREESAWREHHVNVTEAHWGFFDTHHQNAVRLERATRVLPLDYRWRLGRTANAAPSAP